MLPYHLTVQQQALRCLCGRYLAWQVLGAGTQDARDAEPVCCCCWRSPDACRVNGPISPPSGAWRSTSPTLPSLVFSRDGGHLWSGPFTVPPATSAEPQHVHPAVSIRSPGRSPIGAVGYYF
jgi:hypothetical protein